MSANFTKFTQNLVQDIMPQLIFDTFIEAPLSVVFDLARSIDLHKYSAKKTGEESIGGVTTGLIEMGQQVRWRARHFGVRQTLTVRITAMERPYFFEDKMVHGIFYSMEHQHFFEEVEHGKIIMRDIFNFEAPFGVLGKFAESLFLTRYMRKFIEERNQVIKEVAESGRYVDYIPE
ncbi:SRPBCC family protein [uncultured Sphingobacterium sp.]|uniref:SRPBCC family protein n=1 Tax=uncultured Sphingobacterium sp. TaxID=182688 RepID=UPI0025E5D072|nr:SRPBCC family protein [uncultured Sphingobacterium sp.]